MMDLKQQEYFGFLIALSFIILGLVCLYLGFTNIIFFRLFLAHNTSLFELGRLVFSAVLLQSIIQYYIFGKHYDNFFFAKAATLFIAPIFLISTSYLSALMFKQVFYLFHILMLVLGLGIGQMISYHFLDTGYYFPLMNGYAFFGSIIMLVIFFSLLGKTKHFQAPIYKPIYYYEQQIQASRL